MDTYLYRNDTGNPTKSKSATLTLNPFRVQEPRVDIPRDPNTPELRNIPPTIIFRPLQFQAYSLNEGYWDL